MTWSEWGFAFAIAVTFHNFEEAIWLPQWSQRAGRWHMAVDAFSFRFAVMVLTILAYGIAVWSAGSDREGWSAYLLAGYALAMLLNVFFPHVLATIALRKYAPGTATALLFNLPVCSGLILFGFREKIISQGTFLWFGLLVVVGIIASIILLFSLGKRIKLSLRV